MFTSTPTDAYRSDVELNKTNVLGGQWSLKWIEDPMRFHGANSFAGVGGAISGFGILPSGFPLNPQNLSSVELSYTQPLLQGGGLRVELLAPVVIARLDTERSFYQYKDSVQELVRGTIEAYWTLVQARNGRLGAQNSGRAIERSLRARAGPAENRLRRPGIRRTVPGVVLAVPRQPDRRRGDCAGARKAAAKFELGCRLRTTAG